MSTTRLDLILGPENAARILRRLAAELVRLDHLHPDTALRQVCERAADGDPLLLAAPGQTWTLRDDADPDEAPARRIAVHARLTSPPRLLVSDPDLPDSEVDELLLEVLDMYRLEAWPVTAVLDGGPR